MASSRNQSQERGWQSSALKVQTIRASAAYRDLRDGELVRAQGLFVAEGRIVVRRVIEDARYRVQSVLVNEAALKDLEPALAVARGRCAGPGLQRRRSRRHRRLRRAPRMSGARPPAAARAGRRGRRTAAATLVVLEGVSNADNVGGVFRNAAAFGAGRRADEPDLLRSAVSQGDPDLDGRGAARAVRPRRGSDWPGVLMRVRAAGFTIVALTPREPSETLDAFAARPRPPQVALVVGTEGAGLTPAVESAADYRVRIPISDGRFVEPRRRRRHRVIRAAEPELGPSPRSDATVTQHRPEHVEPRTSAQSAHRFDKPHPERAKGRRAHHTCVSPAVS